MASNSNRRTEPHSPDGPPGVSTTKHLMTLDRRQFVLRTTQVALASWPVCRQTGASEDGNDLIIDTHQHLWDLSKRDMPWLADAPAVLKHNYWTQEYRHATEGLNVKAVYMEVDVATKQLAEEARSIVEICRSGKHPTLAAVIGGRPESPGFAAYLEQFKNSEEVKGVRRVLHSSATNPGYCLQESFIHGMRLLGQRGLSFDLCMRPGDLTDGEKLAERCPETRFVLDHCGNADPVAFQSSKSGREKASHTADQWKIAIERLARRPNVICKISGIIARLPEGGDAEDLAPIVKHCLDTFGPDRVVFGGDWPVCLLGGTLAKWIELLRQIVASRPPDEQRKLWAENAIRFYGLTV